MHAPLAKHQQVSSEHKDHLHVGNQPMQIPYAHREIICQHKCGTQYPKLGALPSLGSLALLPQPPMHRALGQLSVYLSQLRSCSGRPAKRQHIRQASSQARVQSLSVTQYKVKLKVR